MKNIFFIASVLLVYPFDLASISIVVPTADKIHISYRTISELKKFFKQNNSQYLEHMDFAYKPVLQRDMKKDLYYLEHKDVADSLTKKYARVIRKNYRGPIELRFVNAKVGYGVFAHKKINNGDLVQVYTGVVDLKKNISDKDYCWAYPVHSDDDQALSCDAKFKGNEMRYVNHSFCPNVIMKYVLVDNVWYICYIATQDILADQQLLVDYGKSYWDTRNIPCETL
jgi:SET domain-containing protein